MPAIKLLTNADDALYIGTCQEGLALTKQACQHFQSLYMIQKRAVP